MKIRKSILSFIIAIALLAGVLGVPAVEAGTYSLVGAPVVGAHIAVEPSGEQNLTYEFFRAPTGTNDWGNPFLTLHSGWYTVTDADIDHDLVVNISRKSDGEFLHQTNKIGPVVKFSRDYQLTGNPVVGEVISVDAPDVSNPLFVFYRNSGENGNWVEIHRSSDSNSYLLQSADEGFKFLVNVHTNDYLNFDNTPLFLHQTNQIGPVARDSGELTLSKVLGENKYQINIANWNPNFSYQIWTYEKISSGLSGVEDTNQWNLKQVYKKGESFVQDNDGTIKHIFEEFDSVDDRYTVAVKVIDSAGNFVRQMKDTFTSAEIGKVVISKIIVDGQFADDKKIVKEIRSGATVNMEVFTNDVQNITYTATVQPGNITLNSSDNTFDWNISGLAPGSYTVTFEAQNGNSSDTRTVKFNLFSVSTPAGGFASFGTRRPGVTRNDNEFTFNANTPDENPSGMQYRYTLSEPWSTTLRNQISTNNSQTLSLDVNQYGIYHAITRLYRPGSSTVDDGAIVTVNYGRDGIGNLTLNVGQAGGQSNKGTPITIDPSITGGTLPDVQYSFWRRDATGWRRIRDYAEGGITWTPARIGDYTIQVRAKGEGAGSYELVRNIEFNITDATETDTKLTVNGGITLNWSDNPTARRPVTLTANAVNPSSGDVLYKFIISDGYLFYIETGYSADPTYTFVAGSARTYNVSVLVKNSASFGKYDAVDTIQVIVN